MEDLRALESVCSNLCGDVEARVSRLQKHVEEAERISLTPRSASDGNPAERQKLHGLPSPTFVSRPNKLRHRIVFESKFRKCHHFGWWFLHEISSIDVLHIFSTPLSVKHQFSLTIRVSQQQKARKCSQCTMIAKLTLRRTF